MSTDHSSPLARGVACGKLILLGEHFVVHGVPALALPLPEVQTEVAVCPGAGPGPTLHSEVPAGALAGARRLLDHALEALALGRPRWRVEVNSTIPLGHGLGSSAAFSVALLRALAAAGGAPLTPEALNAEAFALERLTHGQPSGVDNTVVAHGRPVWFCRGEAPRFLSLPGELPLVLGSSGAPGSTRQAVARVARLAGEWPDAFGRLCDEARRAGAEGRRALEAGALSALGRVLDRFQALLQAVGVSTPGLDRLVTAAREAGALGAKLTGAGDGGFMVALCAPGGEPAVAAALAEAGAAQVLGGRARRGGDDR